MFDWLVKANQAGSVPQSFWELYTVIPSTAAQHVLVGQSQITFTIKDFDFGRSFGIKDEFFSKKSFKVSVNPVELNEKKYRKGASACFNPDTLSLFISSL